MKRPAVLVAAMAPLVALLLACPPKVGDDVIDGGSGPDGAATPAPGSSPTGSPVGDAGGPGEVADADAGSTPDSGPPPEAGTPADGGCLALPTHIIDGGLVVGCAASPHECCYPDATNTGVAAGSMLGSLTGNVTVALNGLTLENQDIKGPVDIQASNVTLRNVRITVSAPSSFAVAIRAGAANVTLEDCEIRGKDNGANSVEYAIDNVGGTGVIVRRANIYNCSECIVGGDITVVDSYIHDTVKPPVGQVENVHGLARSVFTHNTMLNAFNETAVVYLEPNLSGTYDCQCSVTDSLLAGGGYTVYGGGSATHSAMNVLVQGNRFAKTYYPTSGLDGVDRYFDALAAGSSWTGNVWDDTGAAVSP